MRTYGQGDVLATVAYMENELGLKTMVNKDMITQANFVLKQIMPFYDRYCSPYFQGTELQRRVSLHARRCHLRPRRKAP